MKYKDLNIIGKIWYFLLFPLIASFILSVTILAATFAFLMKLFKVIGLLDGFHAWTTMLAEGFTKNFKNAGIRKDNK